MRYTQEQSVQNYRKFINTFYQLTKDRAIKICAIDMCREYHVSSTILSFMQKRGYVQKSNMNEYKWIHPTAPSNHVCDSLRRATCNYHMEMHKSYKTQKEKEIENLAAETRVTPVTSIPKMRAKKKSFSFFWGLIKFNY